MSKRIMALIILSTALPAQAAETWRDSNYPHRREITLENDNMDSTLSNFTLLIKLVDGDAVDKDNIAAGRYTFYDSSGIQLDFQNEAYSEGASYVNMETWVEIGTLNADDTTTTDDSIWIYYGYDGGDQDDGTGAWNADGNWVAVWHLNETDIDGGSGDIKDSTSNGNDGTTQGGLSGADQVAGQVGGSIDFEVDDSDYIDLGDNNSLDIGTSDFSLSAWSKAESFGETTVLLGKASGTENGYRWRQQGDNLKDIRVDSGPGVAIDADTAISDTGWHYFAVSADRDGNAIHYLDGISDGTGDISASAGDMTNTTPLFMGANAVGDANADGILDEIRISSTIRTAEWIKYAHANMGGQADNELIVGSEEALGYDISGRVFEDANFTGTASTWDGGTNDLALANVDVELYTSADVYQSSTTTDINGDYSFLSLADGD